MLLTYLAIAKLYIIFIQAVSCIALHSFYVKSKNYRSRNKKAIK